MLLSEIQKATAVHERRQLKEPAKKPVKKPEFKKFTGDLKKFTGVRVKKDAAMLTFGEDSIISTRVLSRSCCEIN